MQRITVRDMQSDDEEFVGTCSHVGETKERTASCWRRIPWLREQYQLTVNLHKYNSLHA